MTTKRWCSTCSSSGYHTNGCPDAEEPTSYPERDPDDVSDEERDFDYQRQLDAVADAWERKRS